MIANEIWNSCEKSSRKQAVAVPFDFPSFCLKSCWTYLLNDGEKGSRWSTLPKLKTHRKGCREASTWPKIEAFFKTQSHSYRLLANQKHVSSVFYCFCCFEVLEWLCFFRLLLKKQDFNSYYYGHIETRFWSDASCKNQQMKELIYKINTYTVILP